MGKHAYSHTVLACTLSTRVEGNLRTRQDNSQEKPLPGIR